MPGAAMKLRYKILSGLAVVVVGVVVAFAATISYTSSCPEPPVVSDSDETMLAVRARCYGSPDVLTLERVEKPAPNDNELLVRVVAAGVNPLDYHFMRGAPYIVRLMAGIGRPDNPTVGVDFAGVVEAVGPNVTRFKPGDVVFGGGSGAFAEYLVIPESDAVARKPGNVSFAQAAGVAVAGVTALQALEDKGQLTEGQDVLINGASGGVGTFAVQIAKSMGADVTGVCSTRNVELVAGLGADRVIDYTQENYVDRDQRFDLLVDIVGNFSPSQNVDVLKPGGRFVLVGGPKGNWLAPFKRPLQAMWTSLFVDEQLITLFATLDRDGMETLARLLADGKVAPVIDRRYALSDVAEAIRHSETRRARGKLIIDASPATDETRLDLAKRYASAWSSQDPSALAAFYSEDGWLRVNNGEPAIGRAAIEAKARDFMTAFPDMEVQLEHLEQIGDKSVFHWHWTGTNTGPGGSGNAVDLYGYEEWTIDDSGLIVQSLGNYDEESYAHQIMEDH
jgi:uncharacterized protein (TIGR02246 family)